MAKLLNIFYVLYLLSQKQHEPRLEQYLKNNKLYVKYKKVFYVLCAFFPEPLNSCE